LAYPRVVQQPLSCIVEAPSYHSPELQFESLGISTEFLEGYVYTSGTRHALSNIKRREPDVQ